MAKVIEVFNSISGEVSPYHQGRMTTFLRLAGCNLECEYCDTICRGDNISMNVGDGELYQHVADYYSKTGALCITGGEPLLQPKVVDMFRGWDNVWIETNGTLDFSDYGFEGVGLVVDYKLHHMDDQAIPGFFYTLGPKHFLKFVIANHEEFFRFLQLAKGKLPRKVQLVVSPVHNTVDVSTLLKWLLDNDIQNVIINTQLHKYVGLK